MKNNRRTNVDFCFLSLTESDSMNISKQKMLLRISITRIVSTPLILLILILFIILLLIHGYANVTSANELTHENKSMHIQSTRMFKVVQILLRNNIPVQHGTIRDITNCIKVLDDALIVDDTEVH